VLPNEIDALRALILVERAAHAAIIAERDKLAIRNERREAIIAAIRPAHFRRKTERITHDQLALALEELEHARFPSPVVAPLHGHRAGLERSHGPRDLAG